MLCSLSLYNWCLMTPTMMRYKKNKGMECFVWASIKLFYSCISCCVLSLYEMHMYQGIIKYKQVHCIYDVFFTYIWRARVSVFDSFNQFWSMTQICHKMHANRLCYLLLQLCTKWLSSGISLISWRANIFAIKLSGR